MIIAKIDGNKITVSPCGDIFATGSMNYNQATFSFSSQWSNLTKVVVFKVEKEEKITFLDSNNKCYVPYQLLDENNIGKTLRVGASGLMASLTTGSATFSLENNSWSVSSSSDFYNDISLLKAGDTVTISNSVGWTIPMNAAIIATCAITEEKVTFQLADQTGELENNATADFSFYKNALIISTPYAEVGRIQDGANGAADTSLNPSLPIWQEVLSQMGDLNDLDTVNKTNLVSAINEVQKATDKTYVYNQLIASVTWNIDHNLNKFPSVTIVDSGENIVTGDVIYVNKNRLSINFTAPFSGVAYLN